jgi:N-glycosylase/DNA lyase
MILVLLTAIATGKVLTGVSVLRIDREVKLKSWKNIPIPISKVSLLFLYPIVSTRASRLRFCHHFAYYQPALFLIRSRSHKRKLLQNSVSFCRTLKCATLHQLQQPKMGVESDCKSDNNIVYNNDNDYDDKSMNRFQSKKVMKNSDTNNTVTTIRRSKRQRVTTAPITSILPSSNEPKTNDTLIHTTRNTLVQKRAKVTTAHSRGDNNDTEIVVPMTPLSSSSLNFNQQLGETDVCISTNHTRTSIGKGKDISRNITRWVTPEPVVSNGTSTMSSSTSLSNAIQPNRTLSFVDTKIDTITSTHACTNDGYIDLNIPPCEFRASASLTTGQCFHWRAINSSNPIKHQEAVSDQQHQQSAWGIHNATEWVGILRIAHPTSLSTMITSSATTDTTQDNDSLSVSSIVVSIRETPETTLYKTLFAEDHVNVTKHLLSYIQIIPPSYSPECINNTQVEKFLHQQQDDNTSLENLYTEWSSQCPRLKQIASCIPGVRVLNQDPWECFVSFLCSSNNNIPRITKMLQSIREVYGTELPVYSKVDTNTSEPTIYYSFPSLNELMTKATEHDLRTKCGMGYRARYLIESMKLLSSLGGEQYLHKLKYSTNDPIIVQEQLVQFMGIGRKVADCIALFSLNQCTAIPVDVHVWNIARRDYVSSSKQQQLHSLLRNATSVTPTIYTTVGNIFRQRFPTKSGWAHSLLFVAELPSFRPVLPLKLLQEMDRVSYKSQS